jgi:hypothetical protein
MHDLDFSGAMANLIAWNSRSFPSVYVLIFIEFCIFIYSSNVNKYK